MTLHGIDADSDPNLEAFARGLGQAQADAAEAKATLRGSRNVVGVVGELELVKTELQHLNERVSEIKELFSAWYRQLDTKVDVMTSCVQAGNSRRLHPLVTALLVCCIVVITATGVAIAFAGLNAVSVMERMERRALEAER